MGKQRPLLAALMAAAGTAGLYRYWVRPWIMTWGADDEEAARPLPGDELITANAARSTRAVTIDAPRDAVWPWIAQIGEDRGGFYSYTWLERAVGARMHNADTIHPEWQRVGVGQTVWLARRYGDMGRQVVAAIQPDSHLVLVSPEDFDRIQCGEKASGAWQFCLRQHGGWTRLLVRGSGGAVGKSWFDLAHFVMEQKMLRGIRARAEQTRRDRTIASLARISASAK